MENAPKKRPVSVVVLRVFLIVALGAGLLVTWTYYRKNLTPPAIDQSTPTNAAHREVQELLDQTKGSAEEHAQLAFEQSNSPNPSVRVAASKALGRVGTKEAFKRLVDLTNDPNETVRIESIRALGAFSEKIQDPLKKLARSDSRPAAEKMAAWVSLAKGAAPAAKKEAVNELISLWTAKIGRVSEISLQEAALILPKDPSVISEYHKIAQETGPAHLLPVAIAHLSKEEPSYVRAQYPRFQKLKNPEVRSTLIDHLHNVCPPNRQTYISEWLNEKLTPSEYSHLVQELIILDEDFSVGYLEKISSQSGLDKKLTARALLGATNLKKRKPNPFCLKK